MKLAAVVFDYGKVISLDEDPTYRQKMIALSGLEPELFYEGYWEFRDQYDGGHLTGRDYWKAIAEKAGVEFNHEQLDGLIDADIKMWSRINQPVLNWAKAVKYAGLKTGILSNFGDVQLEFMRANSPWIQDFDHCTWSSELRMHKPDPAIYIHTLEKLDVKPEEALFIDDKPVNIQAAEEVGMHGIVFTTVEALSEELKRRGLDRQLPLPATA